MALSWRRLPRTRTLIAAGALILLLIGYASLDLAFVNSRPANFAQGLHKDILDSRAGPVRNLHTAGESGVFIQASSADKGGTTRAGAKALGGQAWWKYVQELGGWQNFVDLVVATTPRIHYPGNKPHYPRASNTPDARELESRLALTVKKRFAAPGGPAPLEDRRFVKGSGEFSWFSWTHKPDPVMRDRIIEDELQEMVNTRLHRRGFPQGVKRPSGGVKTPEGHPALLRDRLLEKPSSVSEPATEGEQLESGELLVDVGEGLMADVGFHAANVTLDPGIVGVFFSVCGETCERFGTCHEDLGRCDCPWDRSGKECADLAMPACRINENRTIPCNQPAPCACYLECERFGFGHSHACFGISPPYKSEDAVWKAPQVVMRTDGRGREETAIRTAVTESDPNWRKVLPSRHCPLGCSNVGWCEQDSEPGIEPPLAHCNCPFGFAGAGCETPEKRRDIRISCLNDCSGRGECNRGFCHCKPGAFGIDCSLSRGPSPGTPSLVFTQPGTLLETGSEDRGRMQKDEQSWAYNYEQSRRPIFLAKKRSEVELEEAGFADPLFLPEPPPPPSPTSRYVPPVAMGNVPFQGGAGAFQLPFVQPRLVELHPPQQETASVLAQGVGIVAQNNTQAASGGEERGLQVTPPPQQGANQTDSAEFGGTGQSEPQVNPGESQVSDAKGEGNGEKPPEGVVAQGEEGGAERREEIETSGKEKPVEKEGGGRKEETDPVRLEQDLPVTEGQEEAGIADGAETAHAEVKTEKVVVESEESASVEVGGQEALAAERFEADGNEKGGFAENIEGGVEGSADVAGEEKTEVRRLLQNVWSKVGGGVSRGRAPGERGVGKGANRALLVDGDGEIQTAFVQRVIDSDVDRVPEQHLGSLEGNTTVGGNVSRNSTVGRNLSGNSTARRNVSSTPNVTNTTGVFVPYKTLSPKEMDELYLNQTVENLIRQETMRWSALQRAYPNNTYYQTGPVFNITTLRQTAQMQLESVRQQLAMQQRMREAKLEEERKFLASLQHTRNKTRGRGAVQPLVYVYELPPHLNTWTYVHSGAGADRTAPVIFLERLLHSPYRTTDPQLADYFFVPAWPRWHLNRGPYLESVVEYLNATWPFFAARGGTDHIWFTTDDWGPCEETGLRNPVIGAGILLTFWGYNKNALNEEREPCLIPAQDIVVPPNLEYNILAKRREAEERGRLENSWKNRTNWFYFAGSSGRLAEGTGTGRKEYSFGVRQAVFDNFEEDSRFKLEELRFGESDYLAEMADSLFCLAPSGHGWGTRATQAAILGCIPVVIQDNVTQPFEYDLIDWETFGVRIRNEDVPRIPDILGAIHVAEIEKKQKVMAQVWSRFLWQSHSEGPLEVIQPGPYKDDLEEVLRNRDAFSTTMEVLRQRLQSVDY